MSEDLPPLQDQINTLKERLDKETTRPKRVLNWIGLILATLAALFAVPKGALDLWEAFNTRPDTHLTPESYLVMTYDPIPKTLQFGFAFTASNNGKRSDTIRNLSATLTRVDYPSSAPLILFSDTDFQLTEKDSPVLNHFSVTENGPRAINSQIGGYLSDQTKGGFLINKSRWKLAITLTGDYQKKNILEYCFDISEDDIHDIFGSLKKETVKIKNPNCEGVKK